MNDATRKYLDYAKQHGSTLGAEEALGKIVMRQVELHIVARELGTKIPNWYGDMLGKPGEPIIFEPEDK